MDKKRFTLNETILERCSKINWILGKCDGLAGAKPQPKLRRLNRIKTIQGSLAIEGNSLSLDQTTAVLDGKRVLGPKKEIIEVQNASRVYDRIRELNPYSTYSLLDAHGMLMDGILPDAGKWRSGAVGIFKGTKVTYLAPKAQFVHGMVKEAMQFVKKSKTTPLITSSVFHHECEVIHPFSDGNGRIGRLWQHLLLVRFHPVFEFVPIESVISTRQKEYYKALEQSDRAGESTLFVEFMLGAILDGTQSLIGEMRGGQVTGQDRLMTAQEKLGREWFSRKDYQSLLIRLSSPTASRDLKLGVDMGLLERRGDKALARYRFYEQK